MLVHTYHEGSACHVGPESKDESLDNLRAEEESEYVTESELACLIPAEEQQQVGNKAPNGRGEYSYEYSTRLMETDLLD